METLFLILLLLLLLLALLSGYPVAFALASTAILTIAAATLTAYLLEGNPAAYLSNGDASHWLNQTITDLLSLYGGERDSLIALPLFLFMAITLQRANLLGTSGSLGLVFLAASVLLVLADQLNLAAKIANTDREALYKTTTGEFPLPLDYHVLPVQAGDLLLAALIPGLLLAGLYTAYRLVIDSQNPEGQQGSGKLHSVLSAVPTLALLALMLGFLFFGAADANQIGAIGAVGAILLAGLRTHQGSWLWKWLPFLLAVIAADVLAYQVLNNGQPHRATPVTLLAVAVLLVGLLWSLWRLYRQDTLAAILLDTSKATARLFMLLIGAMIFATALRAFGADELIRVGLQHISAGFWAQLVLVLLVAFLLSFWLGAVEIIAILIPLTAPSLLMNPESNVPAIWLGCLFILTLQVALLKTAPFGFNLPHLPQIAGRDAIVFIVLALLLAVLVGFYPGLSNYLPNHARLLSGTSLPADSPRFQACLQDYTQAQLDQTGSAALPASFAELKQLDVAYLPDKLRTNLLDSHAGLEKGMQLLSTLQKDRAERTALDSLYAELHQQVRSHPDETPPTEWETQHKRYNDRQTHVLTTQRAYYNTLETAYQALYHAIRSIQATATLKAITPEIMGLETIIRTSPVTEAITRIENVEAHLATAGEGTLQALLYQARSQLRLEDSPDSRDKAIALQQQVKTALSGEMAWRERADRELLPALQKHYAWVNATFGKHPPEHLTGDQARQVAVCLSRHEDISLQF